ncbi:unnamed protein product [Peniophora sp. CBMAI 1063]|nr:unnamed protein product [Peniophora sp. CBMAI 1063]
MPEGRELLFQYLQADDWLESERGKPGWDPTLHNIFVDITEDERETTGSRRLKNGYIDSISCAMDIRRGSKSKQKPVFPSQYASLDALLASQPRLTGLEHTGRSIILVFGDLLCQIQPLTHTNVQIYDMENWEAVYRTSHLPLIGEHPESKMRTFKCALAFHIGKHVISFNTLDFLFQVSRFPSLSSRSCLTYCTLEVTWVWESERNDPLTGLAHSDYNVLDQWPQFVALWASLLETTVVKKTKTAGLNGLFRNWATNPKNTMYNPGVGAYSVAEVMHLAGLPSDISLGDLLRSPSRLCRYLLALYQFLYTALHRIWVELVCACIHNHILAPRTQQRMKYPDYLHVWAKDVFYTTERHHDAIVAYNATFYNGKTTASNLDVLDAFEPSFLRDAIRNAPEFVPILFGDLAGQMYCNELEDAEVWKDNPLLLTFKRMTDAGLLVSKRAALDSMRFATLFVADSDMRRRMLPTYLYGIVKDKMWTVFVAKRKNNFKLIIGYQRTKRLFRIEVLGTKDVAIGPLEYCGMGMIVKKKSGKGYHIYPSRGAVIMSVPYSAALKATTQAIVKVRVFQDSISGTGQSALNKVELAIRERAHRAFRMVYPKAWAVAAIAKVRVPSTKLIAGPVSVPSQLARRKRTQTEILLAGHSASDIEQSGRGKRRRSSIPSGAYNMLFHSVDVYLK